jgi:radical SAM protein with 4Fe4S-binding SPASM domain
MREWRIPSLFLSGGDPFNFRMIKELLVGCLDLGIKPIIPTKTPLDQGMIDFIVNSNIDEMQFSVDTADGDLSRSLIGRGDNYLSRLFNTIQGMINKGVRIYTNTVVTSLNIGSLNVLIEKMIGLGVKQMTFSQYARSQFRHQDFLFCDQQKIEKLEQQLDHLRIKFPDVKLYFRHIKDHTILDHNEKEKFFKDIPECTAGKMGMVILPDGQVTVCENLYYQKDLILGDLKRQSLGEIWFSKRRSEIIEQGNKILAAGECLTCGKAIHCYQKKGKCFVRALQAFGDIRMPDPYCPGSTGGARIL